MIKINTEKIDIKKLNEIDDILYPNKEFFIGSMVGIIIILLFFLFLIPITLGTFSSKIFIDMVDFFTEKNLPLEKVEEIAKNINTIIQKELDKCDISNIDDTLLYLYKNNKENYDKAKESKDKAIEMINDIITFQVNNSIEMKQE